MRLTPFAITMALTLGTAVQAATDAALEKAINPEAISWVQRMSHTLTAAEAFHAQIEANQTFDAPNGSQQSQTLTIALDRHDRFGIRAHAGNRWVYYNRRYLSVVDESVGVFANALVPTEFDQALTTAFGTYGIAVPLADFLFSDPSQALLGEITSARVDQRGEINGSAAVRLRFSQPGIEWSLWLTQDQRALPVRLELSYTEEAGSPRKTFDFLNWNLQPQLTQTDFQFLPEQGMAKVEFLTR